MLYFTLPSNSLLEQLALKVASGLKDAPTEQRRYGGVTYVKYPTTQDLVDMMDEFAKIQGNHLEEAVKAAGINRPPPSRQGALLRVKDGCFRNGPNITTLLVVILDHGMENDPARSQNNEQLCRKSFFHVRSLELPEEEHVVDISPGSAILIFGNASFETEPQDCLVFMLRHLSSSVANTDR